MWAIERLDEEVAFLAVGDVVIIGNGYLRDCEGEIWRHRLRFDVV